MIIIDYIKYQKKKIIYKLSDLYGIISFESNFTNNLNQGAIIVNKKELVSELAKETGTTMKESEKVLNAFIKIVEEELENGGNVRLVGFGSFTVKERAQRKGVDPRTKKPIDIPARKVPKFVPGKELKEKVM